MFSRGVETPVFSGSISGCEVHVHPGVAYQFFVQARNDAGLSSPSARVAINVPVLLASHRASKSGGGLQLEGSPEGDGQQAVTLEAGTTHSSNERRRGEAKGRLNLASQAALDCPSDANLDALRQAIRAAVVAGVNVLLLDRARAKLQKAHNAKETRGAMEARLRSSLASKNPQSLKMLITLAEGVGVTNTHEGCLLATAKARLVALTAAADLASQHARATAQQQEQVPCRPSSNLPLPCAHHNHRMLTPCSHTNRSVSCSPRRRHAARRRSRMSSCRWQSKHHFRQRTPKVRGSGDQPRWWLRLTPRCSRWLRARGEALAEVTAEASLDRRSSDSMLLKNRVLLSRHVLNRRVLNRRVLLSRRGLSCCMTRHLLLRPMHQWRAQGAKRFSRRCALHQTSHPCVRRCWTSPQFAATWRSAQRCTQWSRWRSWPRSARVRDDGSKRSESR